jgi:hypothetical protein
MEMVAGYWVIEVKRKRRHEWMSRAPFGPGITTQLRQIFETEDFAPSDPTGEIAPGAGPDKVAARKG